MLVERELAIRDFVPEDYREVARTRSRVRASVPYTTRPPKRITSRTRSSVSDRVLRIVTRTRRKAKASRSFDLIVFTMLASKPPPLYFSKSA
jgi:DNA topoisomerase IA